MGVSPEHLRGWANSSSAMGTPKAGEIGGTGHSCAGLCLEGRHRCCEVDLEREAELMHRCIGRLSQAAKHPDHRAGNADRGNVA
jgi:hypothetical protein